MRLSHLLVTTIIAIAVGLTGCGKKGDSESKTIRISAIPDENPTQLQRKFGAMADYLSTKLGAKVEYTPVTDYGAVVQGLAAGKVDFAWFGGFTHVQSRVMDGSIPLVMRDIDREFKSVFIAHVDSGINAMADLKGKTFAFGSKGSTSGHLMPRHFLLNEHQIDPEKDFNGKPLYSGAHDATVKMVESGKVQAGALNIEVWERLLRENKVDTSKIKVVWTTPGYVDYVWTARKGTTPEMREAFKQAFLALDAANPEHKKLIELAGAKTKFVEASPADFDAIEQVARSTGLLTAEKK
jgi:phosphonate transport system substrate-binding protein